MLKVLYLGVTVTCEDGTVYKGDILVGADGIHSKVREFMFDKLEEEGELKNKVSKTRKGSFIFFK